MASGLIIPFLNPLSEYIKGWFYWIPENVGLEMGLSDVFTKCKLIQTYVHFFVFIVIVAPFIEERHFFRGFLLPRMLDELGWCGPIIHSL